MFATLNEFYHSLQNMPAADDVWRESARARQQTLTKPPGSLGRLEELAIFLAGWGKQAEPSAERTKTLIFAGNHGVTTQNVSPYPSTVTAQMVQNFENQGAAINAITTMLDIDLEVIPIHLEAPTGDISQEPALSEQKLLEALNLGAKAVPDALDVLCLGEMGIGNTTIAAALAAATFGGTGAQWAGAGTGLDQKGITHKANIIDQALKRFHDQDIQKSALSIMLHLGGRETAALAGATVAARMKSIPIVLDGFIVCASIAPLLLHNKKILNHCLAGHLSTEQAHKTLLQHFELQPILDLDMRLGEGSGASLAIAILKCAVATHSQMATFEQANVDNREK